jgi:hypothetical protein
MTITNTVFYNVMQCSLVVTDAPKEHATSVLSVEQ